MYFTFVDGVNSNGYQMTQRPNFFIVGAAKAGTTALWALLKKHPQVFMAGDDIADKEPCFFVGGYGMNSLDKYLSLFSSCDGEKVIGEASTAYLSDPKSASKIHDFNPNAKILICLRNPADRAYSLYSWMVQEGYEWIYPFERAILNEGKRIEKRIPNLMERAYRDDYMYFSSGLYYNQVKKYLDLFGGNVKVIIFEEMIANPQVVLDECMDFLEISRMPVELARENPSTSVISPKLQWILRSLDTLRVKINHNWRRDFFVLCGRKDIRPSKLNSKVREQLLDRYETDISLLEKLLSKNLTIWRR